MEGGQVTSHGIGGIHGPAVRPGLPEGQPRTGEVQRQPGAPLPKIADGTAVNGLVLEAREEGIYMVRVAGQALLARALERLGPRVRIRIERVAQIERTRNGKFRQIVSRLSGEQ